MILIHLTIYRMVLLIKDAAALFVKWGPSEILNKNAAAALYISTVSYTHLRAHET